MLTHFGGLYLLQQFFQTIKLRSALTQNIRFHQINNLYSISDSILSILYPIILGLGRIETNILLRQNGVFQYLANLPTYPDPTTLRRFLERLGSHGLRAFQTLHDRFRTQFLVKPEPLSSVIFDLDTNVITVYGQQQGARVGFNPKKRGRPSYQPLLCFEGKTGDIWEGTYLSGNAHPVPHTLPLLEKSLSIALGHSGDSGARRFCFLRPLPGRVYRGHPRFLRHCGPDYQTDPGILWFSFLRGGFSSNLVGRVRIQTDSLEEKPTLHCRPAPHSRKTLLADVALQDGGVYLPCDHHQSAAEASQPLAVLQPQSHRGTHHPRAPRRIYPGQSSDAGLGLQSGLFSSGPFCLQLDQLVQTSLSTRRLATVQSSDDPKPIIPGARPIASASRASYIKFAQQLSLRADFFADFGKYQKTDRLKITMLFSHLRIQPDFSHMKVTQDSG